MADIRNNKGFTLIEAIVTIAIVGIVFVPIAFIFNNSLLTSIDTKEQLLANQLAQQYIEMMKAMSVDDFKDFNNMEITNASSIPTGMMKPPEGYSIKLSFQQLSEDYKLTEENSLHYDYKIEFNTIDVDEFYKNQFSLYSSSDDDPQSYQVSSVSYVDSEFNNIREVNIKYSADTTDNVNITHSQSSTIQVNVGNITPLPYMKALIDCNAETDHTGDIITRVNIENKTNNEAVIYLMKPDNDKVNPLINITLGQVKVIYVNKPAETESGDYLIYKISVEVKKDGKVLNTVTATKIL